MIEKTNGQLTVLSEVIATLPIESQTALRDPLDKLNSNLNKKYLTLKWLQEAISQLRVDVKYLIFDLEATRRERDEYKLKWENR